jgi:hypothetical protein
LNRFPGVDRGQVLRDLVRAEGLRGLYRGSLPMLLGGSLFRSAQFGVYESVLGALRGTSPSPPRRMLGFLDPDVAVAGFAGGLSRGLVESPFEFVKVRGGRARPPGGRGGAGLRRNPFSARTLSARSGAKWRNRGAGGMFTAARPLR